MRMIVLMIAVLLLVFAAGCSRDEEPAEQVAAKVEPQAAEPAPTPEPEPAPPPSPPADKVLAELKNATYHGIQEQDPVTLKDGLWEGELAAEGGTSRPRVHFLRDFYKLGDMTGDGQDEAAVVLAASAGGTGENMYVAIVTWKDGKPENLDTVLVGDRVRIRKAAILDGRFFMDLLRHGPKDAMCCPGELAAVAWRLQDGKLVAMEVASDPLRLSLDKIGGLEWVLAWWNLDERAQAEPEVTLTFSEGRLGGSSGCNNYFTEPTEGESPGAVTLGPTGGTMKMCSDDVMDVERRFLTQFEAVKRYGYTAGMLALTYETERGTGVMLFEGRAPK